MGLGLVLSRELISAHGGTISWERTDPHGARFIIELPVEPERRDAA
jgi:K+-sensing histidine kinase KdpD